MSRQIGVRRQEPRLPSTVEVLGSPCGGVWSYGGGSRKFSPCRKKEDVPASLSVRLGSSCRCGPEHVRRAIRRLPRSSSRRRPGRRLRRCGKYITALVDEVPDEKLEDGAVGQVKARLVESGMSYDAASRRCDRRHRWHERAGERPLVPRCRARHGARGPLHLSGSECPSQAA